MVIGIALRCVFFFILLILPLVVITCNSPSLNTTPTYLREGVSGERHRFIPTQANHNHHQHGVMGVNGAHAYHWG